MLKGRIVTGGMAHVDISLIQLNDNHYDGNWSWTAMWNSTNQMYQDEFDLDHNGKREMFVTINVIQRKQ